jgi:hypothetical protein
MTDDAPGFAPLSSDDFDALIEGPNAADNLERFLESGLEKGMSNIGDAIKNEDPWKRDVKPTAAFSTDALVPPPKPRQVKEKPKSSVDAITADSTPEAPEKIDIPLRPMDKKPVQHVRSTPEKEDVQHDTGKVKEERKKTTANAPVTAASEQKEQDEKTPDFRKVSGELLEQKLKERQDKLGDVFKDKGTLS